MASPATPDRSAPPRVVTPLVDDKAPDRLGRDVQTLGNGREQGLGRVVERQREAGKTQHQCRPKLRLGSECVAMPDP